MLACMLRIPRRGIGGRKNCRFVATEQEVVNQPERS